MRRLVDIYRNRIHNLDELIAFDKDNHVPSTFFFGMSNGKYLNYSIKQAEYWINMVRAAGLSVGVHGICYDNKSVMQKEYDTLKSITGLDQFGIRMHYLRTTRDTFDYIEECGYAFDSSHLMMEQPYKKRQMWEFPLHIMDVNMFRNGRPWTNRTFDQVKKLSISLLEQAEQKRISHFNVLLHDGLFSPSFCAVQCWYKWFIQYMKENRYESVNYMDSIEQLER